MKTFMILSSFLILVAGLKAQQCSVLITSLSGVYEGECKGGKAHGKGTAKGKDMYTGEFKNGLPEGSGKYLWSNGDWYEGEWKKGVREGRGTMHYNTPSSDNMQKGFWKNDKYLGLFLEPYTIHNRTGSVSSLRVSKQKGSNLNDLSISIESISGGMTTTAGQIPKIIVTGIDVINGTYLTRYNQNNMPKSSTTTLRNITFPFRAKFYMGQDNIEIEIFEAGHWGIDVKIQK